MDIRVPITGNPSQGSAPGSADPGASVSPEAVRVQLERLLASTALRYSERLSRFLKFVVEQALAGHADQLKESVLAIEIFDRHSSYDSRVDSVVRVEARRLREKLDKYYKADGLEDAVIIELPKGSYVPEFRPGARGLTKPPSVRQPAQFRARTVVVALAACVFAAVVLTRWIGSRGARPPAALERLTSDPGLSFQPALSADGRLLAYSADRAGSGVLDIWVRQVPRGVPVRLTDNPADELEPAFSPDGTTIAYRQEGEAGGIYVVPALGGNSTLLAREGYRPRFSPDGARLAFWNGERSFRTAKAFVMPAHGGNPRQVQPDFSYAAYPVWSPDGRYLVFVGGKGMMTGQPAVDQWDWWVAPVEGGPAIKSNARSTFERRGLRAPESGWSHRWIVPYGWTSSGHILFSARSGDQTNIWRISLSTRDGKVGQPLEQLTFGAGRQDYPSAAADGSLVFTALTQKSDVWSVPIQAQTLVAAGPAVRLTSGPADSTRPAVARDGKRLAFVASHSGADNIWVKDLVTQKEAALTATPEEKDAVVISPDGSQVAYGYSPPLRQAIFVLPFEGGKATQLCADCGLPRAWLPGGAGLLFQRTSPTQSFIGAVDPSGHTTTVVQSSGSALFSPSVSADGRWMVLIRRTPPNDHRVMVVPLAGTVAAKDGWIPVSEPGSWVDKPRWAAAGNAVYYVSDHDGFVCIWVRRLDGATKQPVGEPMAVAHFHSGRISLGAVYALDFSAAEDKVVFNLREASGHILLAPARR
jgi:eukaryotic-like serine/threonine-protein kinase